MRHTARARLALALLPLLLVSASGCDLAMAHHGQSASADWRKTWDLPPDGRVEIRNVNGKIDVQTSAGGAVEVVAHKTASAGSVGAAQEALGRIEIAEEASAGGIRLETKMPKNTGGGLFSRVSQQVNYVVKLPAGAEVVMRTVNGGITLEGLSGRVEAQTTNGAVKARNISGPISAATTNGGVEVDLERLAEGGVTLSCTNGGIRLRLPSDAKATLSARVTNGGVSMDGLTLDKSGDNNRRRLEGRLNGGGAPVRIEGTNGGISIIAR